jgi:hypothetical protein
MRLFLTIIVFALLTTTAYAVDVKIAWDPHPNPDLDHFTLYQADTSGNATGPWQKVKEIDKASTTTTITVQDGKNFAWYLTATGTAGNESGPSNVIQLYKPKPIEPPTCLGI